jgi:hypothetical protein
MTSSQYVEKATVMVDLMILSPTFLTASIEWAGVVVTVLAAGLGRSTRNILRSEGL